MCSLIIGPFSLENISDSPIFISLESIRPGAVAGRPAALCLRLPLMTLNLLAESRGLIEVFASRSRIIQTSVQLFNETGVCLYQHL